MKELFKSLLFRTSESTVVRECRRCGTEVSASDTCCPQCEADTISEYKIK
ncbi:hypothetical protein SAMN05192552_10409 [Natrinema hispanicum]|uniref:Small CPxCG-related zinc finger protein n=1 Tax=Natrinema hispanicum TaxID=392421 RepID=A0A1G6WTF1_9EURY|nr:hypothetical protein SAMN05192552_10409 [Natrinema hispanicum]